MANQSITIRDHLTVLLRRKWIIFTTVIVIMLTLYINVNLYTPPYKADVKMLIEGANIDIAEYYKEFSFPSRSLVEGDIIKSNYIVAMVVKALQLHHLPLDYERNFASRLKKILIDFRTKKIKQELEKLPIEKRESMLFNQAVRRLTSAIGFQQVKDTTMFILSVQDYSPIGAVIIANTLSRAYLIYELERQLAEIQLNYGEKHPSFQKIQDKIKAIQKTLDGKPIPDIEAIGPARVKVIEQARDAYPVFKYNKNLFLSLAFILSIVVGIFLAYGFDYLDTTIKSPLDIEKTLQIPFLGSIPFIKTGNKLITSEENQHTILTQFYQNLSKHLVLLTKDKHLRSILITDVEDSEDTAFVIANIGICLTNKNRDYKVLIIDANLRNPVISRVFNIENSHGLADILEERVSFEDAVQLVRTNLFVLPAGQASFNPSTLVGSSRMSNVIKTVMEKYNMVFLVSADLKSFTDGVILSSYVDATAIMINAGKVRREAIKFAIEPLRQSKNLIGAILNNRRLYIPKLVYDRL